MKFSIILSSMSLLSTASAFVLPSTSSSCRSSVVMAPMIIMTGPAGKPAKSKEEDLELTLQVILDYVNTQSSGSDGVVDDDDE